MLAALSLAACRSGVPPSAQVPVGPIAPAALVVAQDGTAAFATIQSALDSMPEGNASNRIVLIRKGTYREKVFITRSHVSLVGEDRDETRIEYAELRRTWRESHPDDWGAAVVNVGPAVTDLVLANLTVSNDYGRDTGDHDHQFAIRSSGDATRIALLHVAMAADGGDTVSLWNSASGLTYYADCDFEGWVDFFCPRGWAFVRDSRFFGHNESASIWHDGSQDEDQKLVIRHSRFDGVPGFPLGRNHRDAQFYLLDSSFSARMADRPIYPASAPESYRWGSRYYYSNCHRDGHDFAWFADNLTSARGAPRDEEITAAWTFGGRWDPEETLPAVLPFPALPRPGDGSRRAEPKGVTLRWLPARNARSQRVSFGATNPPPARKERTAGRYETGPLEAGATYFWRVDSTTAAGTVAGPVWSFSVRPIRIVLVGDSTVTDDSGWGRGFAARLAPGAVCINDAKSGRSSKSYLAEGHWKEALADRPDYVLVQFGHNDMRGKGPEREAEPSTSYRDYLRRYVEEARHAGAVPVVVTSLTRRYFTPEGRIRSDLEAYARAARAVARQMHAPLLDLHARSIEVLDRLGPERGAALGTTKADGNLDKTHLNARGSALFGGLVADEMRRAVPDLARYVRGAGTTGKGRTP